MTTRPSWTAFSSTPGFGPSRSSDPPLDPSYDPSVATFNWSLIAMTLAPFFIAAMATFVSYDIGYADQNFILFMNLYIMCIVPFGNFSSSFTLCLSLYGIFYTLYWVGGYKYAYYKRQLAAEREVRRRQRQITLQTEFSQFLQECANVPVLLYFVLNRLGTWLGKLLVEPFLLPVYFVAWQWHYYGTHHASFWTFWFTPLYPPDGFPRALSSRCRPFLYDFAKERTFIITPWFLQPQASDDWFPGLHQLKELGVNMDELKPMLDTITGEFNQKLVLQLLLFLVSAVQCTTPQHLVTTVALTMNGLTEKGLADQAMQLYKNLTENTDTTTIDAGHLIPESWEDIRNVVDGWADARNSELVGRIEKAMHLMVHVGLASRLGFNVEEKEVANSYEATKKMQSVPDILLFLAQSIIHVGDVLAHYRSDQGSWRSLFRTSGAAKEVDVLYTTVLARQEMYFNGGMDKINSSEQEYLQQVERCLRELSLLHSRGSSNPLEKRVISDKLMKITQLDSLIRLRCSESTIRAAPFCVKASGPTSQGKSVAVDEFQAHILRVNNFPTDRVFSVSLNENDKFDSAIKNNTVCVRMDDYPKILPRYAKTNPIELLMRMLNNERVSAVKAEIDQKGTVFFNNKLLMITTNTATMQAHDYSVAPEAAMRRINVHVHMTVRPEFANEQGHFCPVKFRDAQALLGRLPDTHLHTVQRYKPERIANEENASVGKFVPLLYKWPQLYQDRFGYPAEETLSEIGCEKFLRYLGAASQAHFEHQRKLIINNEAHFSATHCATCLLPSTRCACLLDLQAGERESTPPPMRSYELRQKCREMRQRAFDATSKPQRWFHAARGTLYYTTARLSEIIYNIHLRTALWLGIVRWLSFQVAVHPIITYVALTSVLTVLSSPIIYLMSFVVPASVAWLGCMVWEWYVLYPVLQHMVAFSNLVEGRNFGVRHLLKKIKPLLVFAAMVAGSYAAYRVLRPKEPQPSTVQCVSVQLEGGVMSIPEDAVRRKPQYHINDVGIRALPKGLLTTTPEQVLPIIHKAVAHVILRLGTKTRTCMGIAYRTNRFLINNHSLYFKMDDGSEKLAETMELVFGPRTEGCNMKRIDLSPHDIEVVRGLTDLKTDQAIVNLSGGGSRPDLTRFMAPVVLPAASTQRHLLGIELTKDEYGIPHSLRYPVNAVRIMHWLSPGRHIEGLNEDRPLDSPSYSGLCGAPIITVEGDKTVISGIHFLGGDSKMAFATQVTSTSLLEAEQRMLDRLPTIGPSIEAPLQLQCFSTSDYKFTNAVHFKSVVNDMPLDAEFCTVSDTTMPRVQPHTAIIDRPIKEAVLLHCPCVEDTHEPPSRLRDKDIFAESLFGKVDCTGRIDQEVLTAAFLDIAAEDDMLWREKLTFGPLRKENILPGIAGVAGMESVKLNTSLGLPWRKKKNTVMVREERPMEDGTLPITMKPEWWTEFDRLDALARGGNRLGLAFGASPKDELVKKGKQKVRIFSSANMFLGMLIRKYFLWFIALEMEDPIAHEMAVGINPMGREWTKMANHASAMGRKRSLACDFTEFDARMRYQITRATFNFYIRQAQKSKHYSADDVKAMCVVAEEVCNALMDYNGTFVELMQSFPSGHNMTVHTNNRANRLLHRCAFYAGLIHRMRNESSLTDDEDSDDEFGVTLRERDGAEVMAYVHPLLRTFFKFAGNRLFADFVRLICYGDDMCGTVSPNIPWYNSIYISKYLGKYGYGYTNANKELPTEPYQDWEEIDFLKRKFVWDEAEARWLAPLAWTSITKPLLMGAPPKASSGMSHEEECAQIIGTGPGRGQLGEAYLWGEERYTELRDGLQEAMEDKGMLHYFDGQSLPSYIEQHARWRKKFDGDELEGAFDDEVFDARECAFEGRYATDFYYDARHLDLQVRELDRPMTYYDLIETLPLCLRSRIVYPYWWVTAPLYEDYMVVVERTRCHVGRATAYLRSQGFRLVVKAKRRVVIFEVHNVDRYCPEVVFFAALRHFGPPFVIVRCL